MKRIAVLTTAVAVGLTGCGGSSDGNGRSGTAAPAAGSSAAQPPAGGVRAASCTDAGGDGGPADLTSVALVEGGEGLRATFTLAAPLNTATGSALLSLMVSSRDGGTARQLGVKWVDGTARVFVFDMGAARNEYVHVSPVVAGAAVDVTFPRTAVEGLGDTWRWAAATNVDGRDVDNCPEPTDDVRDPALQPFPS